MTDAERELLMHDANRQGAELAQSVINRFQTTDVFAIAERAGVSIVYERWPLLTIGECEPRAKAVHVNLAALDQWVDREFSTDLLKRAIIAHELGHMFDSYDYSAHDKRLRRQLREDVAHGFASELLRIACEDLKRIYKENR